jgi:hypothetical protein
VDWKIWTLLVLAALVGISVWRRGWRRTLLGPSNLKFEHLDSLLRNPSRTQRFDGNAAPADFGVQLKDGICTVIYSRSQRESAHETLDINVPGMAGMVLHFSAGHLVEFKRIGGGTHQLSELQPEQALYATELLGRTRALIK